jgi:Uma2 family endonuclease
MNAPARLEVRMNVDEFLAWTARQPETEHYELVDGEIVPISPERMWHNLVKLDVVIALREAVRNAGVSCTVFTDGIGIAVNDKTVREPDASVQCGSSVDLASKLLDYFEVASIRHYLIVLPKPRTVIHYRRNDHGSIDTRIVREGDIVLYPPGVTVAVEALLGPATAAKEIH